MALLQKAEITLAYLKCGLFGFQGSGKTYTAVNMAIGLLKLLKENKMAVFDTETGSDFLVPKLQSEKIDVFQVKKRDFSSLVATMDECVDSKVPFLLIDSITHVWRELCDAYDKKLKRRGRLQFQDWAMLKGEWREYTDRFVNLPLHIIVCGRAGFEYDYDFNEDGSKDLIKTGTKMKAEGEFGFEPSLVVEMERLSQNRDEVEKIRGDKKKKSKFAAKVGSKWIHRAHVLKDRADKINGEVFDYPTFENFLPHFQFLNIGGAHLGVDISTDSTERFEDETGRTNWKKKKVQKEILLEEIENTIKKMYPSQSKDDKLARMDLIENFFGKRSWKYVEESSADMLETFLNELKPPLAHQEESESQKTEGEPQTGKSKEMLQAVLMDFYDPDYKDFLAEKNMGIDIGTHTLSSLKWLVNSMRQMHPGREP